MRNRVDNAWAQIEVQLKRRWDLIPNLVETVKGYAEHERGTFEAVTEARANAQRAQGPAETAAAEGILGAGARTALRSRRGVSRAEGGRELPRPPGRARRDREQDRRLAAGLQRHRAHATTTRSRRSRRSCSPGRSASRSASSSRPRTPAPRCPQVDFGAERRAAGSAGAPRPARRPGTGGAPVALGSAPRGSGRRRAHARGGRPGPDVRARLERRPGERPPRRLGGRRRADHRRVLRLVHVRLPRDPAARRRADRRDRRHGERPAVPAGGVDRARRPADRRARSASRTSAGASRVVWRFTSDGDEQRTFVVHYRIARPRGRLRRRRRRQPQGLGRRVGAAPRPADGDDARPGRRRARLGPPGLGARRRAARRARSAPAGARRRAGQFVELRTLLPT